MSKWVRKIYIFLLRLHICVCVCACVCTCVILHKPIHYWSHDHTMFFPVQHCITVPSLLGLALFVNLLLNVENTRMFCLNSKYCISSFCTFLLLLCFVVSSSLFFPCLIHALECSFQKVHRVFLSLSQSWSTTNNIFLSLRSNRNSSHPWPIHKRVASWKIPRHVLHTVLLVSPVSVAFHAGLKENDFLHAWNLTISLGYRMFLIKKP